MNNISFIGLGKLGLPLACVLASAENKVLCLDKNEHILNMLSNGKLPFYEPGLKDLLTEHYITIPDEKVDVVDDLFDKVESLESELNEQVSKNVDIQSELTKVKKEKVLSSLTKDLTETQKEKVAELAENVEAEDAEDFEQKVEVLKENYFPTEDKKVALVEDIETQNNDEESEKEAVPAGMEHYMSAISRHVR